MKTMCPPSYHYNGLVGNRALGHMEHDVHGDNLSVYLSI